MQGDHALGVGLADRDPQPRIAVGVGVQAVQSQPCDLPAPSAAPAQQKQSRSLVRVFEFLDRFHEAVQLGPGSLLRQRFAENTAAAELARVAGCSRFTLYRGSVRACRLPRQLGADCLSGRLREDGVHGRRHLSPDPFRSHQSVSHEVNLYGTNLVFRWACWVRV